MILDIRRWIRETVHHADRIQVIEANWVDCWNKQREIFVGANNPSSTGLSKRGIYKGPDAPRLDLYPESKPRPSSRLLFRSVLYFDIYFGHRYPLLAEKGSHSYSRCR
jgi:hypothetical protein